MRILVVAPDTPYPANHGGRADVLSRLICLKDLNLNVDLLICGKPPLSESASHELSKLVGQISFTNRKTPFSYLLKLKPYQVVSRENLSNFTTNVDYDLVILESEAVSEVLNAPGLRYKTSALRVHNDESRYFSALAKSSKNPIKKAHYIIESLLYKFHSRKIKALVDFELHISKDELNASIRESSDHKCRIFLPSHISPARLNPPKNSASNKALFIGNLFTENNLTGLFWYLNEVHTAVSEQIPDYTLIVAGNTQKSRIGEKIIKYGRIEFHDTPENLEHLYQDAGVFINPTLDGAGVKIRSLNAICQGIPLVSTSVGVEGIGLTDEIHFYEANSPSEFTNKVIFSLKNPAHSSRLAAQAQAHLQSTHDARKTIAALKETIMGSDK